MADNEKNTPVRENEPETAPVEDANTGNEQKEDSCDKKSGGCDGKKQKSSKCKKELEKERDSHAAEIKSMQEKLDAQNDKFMRVVAEYDNFRKRSQREKDGIHNDTKAEVLAKLLPILDNFERAAASGADFEGYKKGVEMTVSQLFEVIKAMGVEAFGEKGDEFDANIHDAVMHGEDSESPENSVSEVFQKGYRLGDRILRCATVKVVN